MPKVLVTGFRPFSILTRATGNPSQVVAESLGERYAADAQLEILDADPTCLTRLESLGKNQALTGVLMLGANVQIAPVVLELEGVSKADGLLGALKHKIASTAASDLQAYARSIGVPSATAPITPLVRRPRSLHPRARVLRRAGQRRRGGSRLDDVYVRGGDRPGIRTCGS